MSQELDYDPQDFEEIDDSVQDYDTHMDIPDEAEEVVLPDFTHIKIADIYWSINDARYVSLEDLQNYENVRIYEEEMIPGLSTDKQLVSILKEYNYPLGQYAPIIYYTSKLKQECENRLDATDYLLNSGSTLTDDQKAIVNAYRQALRDMPNLEGYPWDGGGDKTPWPTLDI